MNDTRTASNCNMHEALVAFLYGEATPDEKTRVEAHLTQCSACKHELDGFERVRGMLQQWQLDDLPVVRVVTERSGRSMLTVLKELFTITPVWAKALGAVAMAMLVLAVIGTDVRVNRDGVSFHADVLRRDRSAQVGGVQNGSSLNGAGIEQVRAEMNSLVNKLIADSERQQKEEIKSQLVSLESQLQSTHSADLAKLVTRVQEQQQKLKAIQQDIDRREGLDLTDILFSEVTKPGDKPSSGGD